MLVYFKRGREREKRALQQKFSLTRDQLLIRSYASYFIGNHTCIVKSLLENFMAMYYQGGSEIQADGLHTLYLMNPNFVENPTNMLHLNPGGATSPHVLNSTPVPILHTHQQVLSIPIANDPDRSSPFISQQQLIQGPAQNPVSRFGYSSWVDQEGGNRNQPQQTPRGLSLSLSTNQTGFSKPVNIDHQDLIQVQTLSKAWSSSSNGVNNNTMQSVVMGSKYLKAAQQLLDEVANVAKSITGDDKHNPGSKDKAKMVKDSDDGNNTEALSGGGSELTTAQRQEIQMKKSNLISMLDEVEQRYRQYNVQMQIIVASFEQAAGIGSAKSYTQVALKTISKQFRCLKDAISSQIKELSKSLGEVEGSKLRYVDNQLRQHRALQQLGMVQNNAWRPQRGLPERAVSVLRAWLFEHFLHPYPKDSDKQMLAKQTGLTRSQVSNWFINARVRLWKPMVEEMYLEEMKTQPQNNTTSSDQNTTTTTTKPDHQLNNHSTDHISASTISPQQGPNPGQLISSLNMENLPGNSWKKPRTDAGEDDDSPNSMLSVEMEMKATRSSYGTPYTTFQDISRFNPGAFHGNYNNTQNSVSLTLGLPPAGTHSHQQHNNGFLNFGTTTEAGLDIGYDQMIGFQNRKPFPAQLLHSDFVS